MVDTQHGDHATGRLGVAPFENDRADDQESTSGR